jgi:NAD(P)H-dependent flavin oxidoreductase YrpB (nitropropane dioxygenase family)
VSYRLDVHGSAPEDDYRLHFDPQTVFPGVVEKVGRLHRPHCLPIISSDALAKALIHRASGQIDGFVIEAPTAGGHNAPPRGPMHLDEWGEPIYGKKDVVNLSKIKRLGLPFWLAGGYDSPEQLQHALDVGATGIQVGTALSYCAESGMEKTLKSRIIQEVMDQQIKVRTDPIVSPTGYPFKVVELGETLSDPKVRQKRIRLCDIGMLRHPYRQADGKIGFRCPAEPIAHYLSKGGKSEDTLGRNCLCNSLRATAGYAQYRNDGYFEPPIVTAGDGLAAIAKYMKPGRYTYTVQDVLDYLTERTVQYSHVKTVNRRGLPLTREA